ncbi:TetR/AcrR family transcriptional regulator [Okibacterium endophyticum]
MLADESAPANVEAALRSDARSNRGRILRAARSTLTDDGIDAPLTTIARRAQVSTATLYRRFPTRDALVNETFAEQLAECTAALHMALKDRDPWHGMCIFIESIFAIQVSDRGFTEAFFVRNPSKAEHPELDRSEKAIAELIRRCQEAGKMRLDVVPSDITLALIANAALVARLPDPKQASARLGGQLLRAFSAGSNQSLPPAPILALGPVLTR